MKIRSLEAKVDLAGYGHADEQPVVKTEVINQLEDIRNRQVQQSHGTLAANKKHKVNQQSTKLGSSKRIGGDLK